MILLKHNRNNKGITLIELVVTMAILSLVLVGSFRIFLFGNETYGSGTKQYNAQSSARLAADYIAKEVRFATALSVIPVPTVTITDEDKFDYIYIESGKLIHSSYNNDAAREVISLSGILADTSSFYPDATSKMLGYNIIADDGDQTYEIDAQIELPNFALIKGNPTVIGSTDKAIRFTKSLDINYDSDTDIGGEDDDVPNLLYTITFKVASNANKEYKISMNGQEESVNKHNAALFSVFTGTYDYIIKEKNGNTYIDRLDLDDTIEVTVANIEILLGGE